MGNTPNTSIVEHEDGNMSIEADYEWRITENNYANWMLGGKMVERINLILNGSSLYIYICTNDTFVVTVHIEIIIIKS